MGKTSSNQEKKKKTKVRKLINRAKNGLQRVRKFCKKHVAPVMLATAIIGGVIFGTYLRATATGVEELYYTYWDLVSSIFAAEGYDMSIKNGNDKISTPDRVTGRQLWNNIKQWVKIKCADAKELYDEFTLLPKAVTAEGIKMSKDLYDLLGDYCAELTVSSSNPNQFDCSSVESVSNMIHSLTGGYLDDGRLRACVEDGYLLNIAFSSGAYDIFVVNPAYGKISTYYDSEIDGNRLYITDSLGCTNRFSTGGSTVRNGETYYDMSIFVFGSDLTWIIKNGAYAGDIFNKVKNAVDLKNAPDQKVDDNIWNKEGNDKGVLPWWYYPDLLDTAMRNQAVDQEQLPDGDPDDGDDNKDKNGKSWKDIIPALIPFAPPIVTPTESESDSSKGTEDSSKPGHKPGSSENPSENPSESEKDSEATATDPSDLPPIADRGGNWKRLFPFCIPWDIMSLVKTMKADKKAPVFEFEYTFKAVNYTWKIRVDMSDYWEYIKIFRWGMTIFFIIGLFFLTVKFTTFVYRMS